MKKRGQANKVFAAVLWKNTGFCQAQPPPTSSLTENAAILIKKLEQSYQKTQKIEVSIANVDSVKCEFQEFAKIFNQYLKIPLQSTSHFQLVSGSAQARLENTYRWEGKQLKVFASLNQAGTGSVASAEVLIPSKHLPSDWLSLDNLLKRLFCELRQSVKKSLPSGKINAIFRNLAYQTTRLGSPMTAYLSERLKSHALNYDFALLEPEEITVRTRGIIKESTPVTSSEGYAEHIGAKAILSGNLWKLSDSVELRLSLRQTNSNQLISQVEISLSRNILPDYRIIPKDPPKISPLPSSGIQLFTNKGENNATTLKEGEVLTIFYTVNQNCYFRVYYQMADQTLVQVFPDAPDSSYTIKEYNRKGEIPPKKAKWRIRIGKPFGYEMILAYASHKRFPKVPGKVGSSGFYEIKMTLPQLVNTLFPRSKPLGEASLIITTLARSQ